jgi:hypothetical protein
MEKEINKITNQELVNGHCSEVEAFNSQNNKQLGDAASDTDLESADIDINSSDDLNEFITYPTEVRIEKAQYSILHLHTLLTKRKELVLDPAFQRHNVWAPKQKSELIESILMGIPIPLMYLFEDQYGKKQVVDGKQRITAILDFLDNKYKLTGLKVLKKFNDKSFNLLEPKMQGVFEDYQLLCYVIQPPTPERVKYDIFDRVNRGGTSLNKQEMRNALYGGKCTRLLEEIAKSDEFKNATGESISCKRMKDHYAILRILSFLMLRNNILTKESEIEYKGDIDDFLAKFMRYINSKADDCIISDSKNLLLKSLSISYEILGKDGFRFNGGSVRRPINMPLMEAIVFFFSQNIDVSNKNRIIQIIETLKTKFDSSNYFKGNVDSTTSIDFRFGEVIIAIKKNEL